MPNESNVGSPISLVAHGRSGTSLLFRAFGELADVDCVGETANMIFTTWRALDQIAGITRYGVIPNPHYKQDAARLVRNAFLQIFPSEKRLWMQKPIGIPRIRWDFPDTRTKPESFIDWYWDVFNESFPESRTFSVVRHPNDVFLSAREYWQFPEDGIWSSQWLMYKILLHPAAKLRCVLSYEDLISNPIEEMRRLMQSLDLPFDEKMLEAFNVLHVPKKGGHVVTDKALLESKQKSNFSRKDRWGAIKITAHTDLARGEYARVCETFGFAQHD